MDKFEDTVVNPNISLNNFEVRVRDDVKEDSSNDQVTSTGLKKKDKNYTKSIILLVLLAGILAYQLSVNF